MAIGQQAPPAADERNAPKTTCQAPPPLLCTLLHVGAHMHSAALGHTLPSERLGQAVLWEQDLSLFFPLLLRAGGA